MGVSIFLTFIKPVRKTLSLTILLIHIAPDRMAEQKGLSRQPLMSFLTGRMIYCRKSINLKKNAKSLMRSTIITGSTGLWGTIHPENI